MERMQPLQWSGQEITLGFYLYLHHFLLASLEALVALKVFVACLLCLKTAYEVNIWTPGGPGESKRAGVWLSGSTGGVVWPFGTFLSHWLCSLASASAHQGKLGFACLIMCGSRGGSALGSRLAHLLCRSLTVP